MRRIFVAQHDNDDGDDDDETVVVGLDDAVRSTSHRVLGTAFSQIFVLLDLEYIYLLFTDASLVPASAYILTLYIYYNLTFLLVCRLT